MSSSEESATATSGSEFLSDSEHNSDVESSDSDANGQPPLARPARTKNAPAKKISSISWVCDDDYFPRRHGFQGTPGVQVHELDENSSPLEIFEQFLTPVLILHITNETNRYAAQHPRSQSASPSHMRSWFDTTPHEMSVFLSMIIIMCLMPKPELKSYWTKDPVLKTPFLPNTMPRDRFAELLSNLHFVDDSHADTTDRLYKLRLVIDELTKKFKSIYIPSSDINTDESLWKFNRGTEV
jgi:hypothetical protein